MSGMTVPIYRIIEKKIEALQLQLIVELVFAKDSVYFDGHFDELTILPAVAQLFVAKRIAEAEFNDLGRFTGLQQVKFKGLIRPADNLRLQLDYNKQTGALLFSYSAKDTLFSSGKLQYQVQQSCQQVK